MRRNMLFGLLLYLTSCLGGDETHFLNCGQGQSIQVENDVYCAYSASLVAELGGEAFECPQRTKARVELQGAVVCSPREDKNSPETLPAETCRPIERACGEDAEEMASSEEMPVPPEADVEANRRLVARSCDALCERNARCYDNDPQRVADTCGARRTECKAGSERLLAVIKTRYFEVTTMCLENTCASSDECTTEGLAAIGVVASKHAPTQACIARSQACSFSDDRCAMYLFATSELTSRMYTCTALPCDQVAECLDRL